MDFAPGYRARTKIKVKHVKSNISIGLNSDSLLIIKLPDSRVLRIISRSLFLAVFIIALPSIVSIITNPSSIDISDSGLIVRPSDFTPFQSLPSVFQDLVGEGLLKNGQKGLLLSSGIGDLVENLWFLNDKKIDLVIDSDLDCQNSIPSEAHDFVFTSSSQSSQFINRVLKVGGFVVMLLGNDHTNEFQKQGSYKIVYLRQFESTVVALRKMNLVDEFGNSQRNQRRLCRFTEEAKKSAMDDLEGVMLEPPRRALAKSSNKKFKFLPDLLGDSLESYNRRILITDENNGVVKWFYENYPTKNQLFDIHILDNEDRDVDVSNWLTKNVREGDYVVMKADSGVVEEMINEKTICLVDELFLECKNEWEDDNGNKKNRRNRAYWQCVALYGRLRDEGVAVHQWWG